jgi:hypothetical protein
MLLCFVFQFVLQGPIAKTMSACSMLQHAKILPSLPPNYEYGKASASGSWKMASLLALHYVQPYYVLSTGNFGRKSLKSIRNYAASCRKPASLSASFDLY